MRTVAIYVTGVVAGIGEVVSMGATRTVTQNNQLNTNRTFVSGKIAGNIGASIAGAIFAGGAAVGGGMGTIATGGALAVPTGVAVAGGLVVAGSGAIQAAENIGNLLSLAKGRSEHAQQRADEGRPVGTANNDAHNARSSDVFIQEDGRWVVRGNNGRIHIFEPDGEHVTTFTNYSTNTQNRIASGQWARPTQEELQQFAALFGNIRI